MEVRGYANAADWVYSHGVEPGEWSDGQLLSLTELRQIHTRTMAPVWDVAPHPDATEQEGPGSFRRHEIEPFSNGMRPPSWPDVAPQVDDWLDQACALRGTPGLELPVAFAAVHTRFERSTHSSTATGVLGASL